MKEYTIRISDKAYKELQTHAMMLAMVYPEGAAMEQAFLMKIMKAFHKGEIPDIQLRSEREGIDE
jgi:hypothetical protein